MATYYPKTLSISKNGDTYVYDAGNIHYGECDTEATTQTKSVLIPEIESLTAGLCVRIKFTYAQDYDGQPKLQVNSLTAANIVRNGTTEAARYEWQAGEVLDFLYDGTNFVIVEGAILNILQNKLTTVTEAPVSTSGFRIYKFLNIVSVFIEKNLTASAPGWTAFNIALPSGYRPKDTFYTSGYDNNADYTKEGLDIRVGNEGSIAVSISSARTVAVRAAITFIAQQ